MLRGIKETKNQKYAREHVRFQLVIHSLRSNWLDSPHSIVTTLPTTEYLNLRHQHSSDECPSGRRHLKDSGFVDTSAGNHIRRNDDKTCLIAEFINLTGTKGLIRRKALDLLKPE